MSSHSKKSKSKFGGAMVVERPLRKNAEEMIKFIVRGPAHLKMGGMKKDDEEIFVGTALSGDQIANYLKHIKGFVGIFTPDELHNAPIPKKGSFALVIFLPNKGDDVGHWIAVVVDTETFYEIDFYDSFGRTPQKLKMNQEMEEFISRVLEVQKPPVFLKYKVNTVEQQDQRKGITEESCGSYVINFILDRLVSKKTFKEATAYNKNYKNVEEREKWVLRATKKKKFRLV